MTNDELLIECKKGLGMPIDSTNFDGPLSQKILIVKSYLLGAGVSLSSLDDDLSTGIIVMGVTDLWNISGGTIKFSPLFYDFATQLVIRSEVIT